MTIARRTLLTGSATAAGLAVLRPPAYAAGAPRPWTVPALRQWTPGTGTFTLGPTTRVVVPASESAALGAVATRLANELAVPFGLSTTAGPGEILLRRAPDAGLGTEGYQLSITGSITLTAPTVTGIFYGTR